MRTEQSGHAHGSVNRLNETYKTRQYGNGTSYTICYSVKAYIFTLQFHSPDRLPAGRINSGIKNGLNDRVKH
jgi:hypothetical protein